MKLSRTGATLLALGASSTLVLSACGSGSGGASAELTGEGATSQENAMNSFRDVAADEDVILAYNGTGSGQGVSKFIDGQVVFGGSDSPLDAKDQEVERAAQRCDGNPAWHLPLVIGPVAVAYNVPGVDDIAMDTKTLAKVFKGEVTKWNDPVIAKQNEGKNLPDETIRVYSRSDNSGTTDNFQKFLSAAAGDVWGDKTGKTFQGKSAGSANGSAGVAQEVSANQYSITYVEAGYAKDLQKVSVDFGMGPVALSDESAGKALDAAQFNDADKNNLVVDSKALFSQHTEGAYPILLTTYEIVCSKGGYSEEERDALKKFLTTALSDDAQKAIAEEGYVPLPEGFKSKLSTSVDAL